MEAYNLVSLAGLPVLLLIAWLLSADRKRLNIRLILFGTGLQLVFAAFVFLVPAGRTVFLALNDLVLKVLESASAGTEFLFGRLAIPPGQTNAAGETSLGFILAFQGLATVVFFASLVGVLYYAGFMQRLIKGFAHVFTRLLRTSGAESLCVSSNIFIGVESVLTVRPYLDGMTRSELCTILTGGMATIASSVLALYVMFLQPTFSTIAGHLISASIISAPAALVMSKLILPETGQPATLGVVVEPEYKRESNLMEAIIAGAMGGVRLAVGVAALLLALLGMVELLDIFLGAIGGLVNSLFGWQMDWSLTGLLELIFYPFTLIIGVPPADAGAIAHIIGERLVVTELKSYQDLATVLSAGALQHPRSTIITAYALCGFAHFASMAVFIGGVSALAPSRAKDLAGVGLRALLAANLACLMTGAVAGALYTSTSVLTGPVTAVEIIVSGTEIQLHSPADKVEPGQAIRAALNRRASDHLSANEAFRHGLLTIDDIRHRQAELRQKFLEAIGGFPDRTPLNAEIRGVISRDGYTVEKVLFESQPRHHVTALLFLPSSGRFPAPYPGVLIPCGHSASGKGDPSYQTAGALLALNGIAALVFDPLDQGERLQVVDSQGKAPWWGTRAHLMAGTKAILLGENLARYEIWDAVRAVDYLQSRPDIDGSKIGCTGNSGGGTQTAYLLALDDRIKAAAPSCYITSFDRLIHTIGPQDAEQNIFGQISFGMDHAEYLFMRAPTPVLVCAAREDFFSIEGTHESVAAARTIFERLGQRACLELAEVDGRHGWHQPLRERSTEWMCRWLAGREVDVEEPQIELLKEEECLVTPRGQVMLMPGERSIYDLFGRAASIAADRRAAIPPEKRIAMVRASAGIRQLEELPRPEAHLIGQGELRDAVAETLRFEFPDGVVLPGILLRPSKVGEGPALLILDEEGCANLDITDKRVSGHLANGGLVLALDPHGVGGAVPTEGQHFYGLFGREGRDVALTYLLGGSFVGLQAEDILACACWLGEGKPVDLSSEGRIGIAALHAAAVEPQLFRDVTIRRSIPSWELVIQTTSVERHFATAVHGALQWYDLEDLVEALGDRVNVEEPADAAGHPIRTDR